MREGRSLRARKTPCYTASEHVAGQDTGLRGWRERRPRGMAVNAAALKQARIAAGLSLAEVAGDSMTKQAVHLFETGQARPTLDKLRSSWGVWATSRSKRRSPTPASTA